MDYQYPFDMEWSKDEVIDVIHFFQLIEKAYEKGAKRDEIMSGYRRFKEIVPGKAEENNFGRDFEQVTGYSLYKTIQKFKQAKEHTLIKMP